MAHAPTRTCIACGQTDDHPRHQTVLPDQSEVGHHMDCGARLNPPCQTCIDVLKTAKVKDKEIGEDMRAKLVDTDLSGVA